MIKNFYDNISCFSELELRRVITGESKQEFLKYCTKVDDNWFCFPIKTSTVWFDKDGNRVDVKDVTLTEIPDRTFEFDRRMFVFDVPPKVTTIGKFAFGGCINLSKVTIPKTVTHINSGAFTDTPFIGNYHSTFVILGSVLYGFKYARWQKEIEIPEEVMNINDFVFDACSWILHVKMPSNLKSIGECVFFDCGGLKTTVIPESVEYVGKNAFYGCDNVVITFAGKTLDEVKAMKNYPFGLREEQMFAKTSK